MRFALLAAALLVLQPAAVSAGVATPRLTVAALAPATVRGTGFKSRELVRVSLHSGTTSATVRVRATARGRFVARFAGTSLDGCTGWAVSARGARGSKAALKAPPQPECPPLAA